ncbi:MAG: DUF4982 domain-containing protein [Bacteroidales bacterium]|nr:DUF4982 domain-containing protein [Bacteroidales bacterium]
MKRHLFLPFAAAFLIGCGNTDDNQRVTEIFNYDWEFSLNNGSPRTLDLPHDWSIEGEFKEDNPSTAGGGALPGGYGVYKKTFLMPTEDSQKQIFLCFDGVYWQSTVTVNGQKMGFRPNGYISFEYDITNAINFGKENTVEVSVDNTNQPNSRWYSGSGIYRNVYLKKVNKTHFVEPEIFITTSEVTSKSANVNITAQITGEGQYDLSVKIKNPDGTTAAEISDKITAGELKKLEKTVVNQPQLWSPETPNIYSAEFSVKKGGKVLDKYVQTFGIRSFSFDADKGFTLNGKQMKINGVCNHHDLGALGAAINHRALERQLEILKNMGCNAIRTSHNPPAKELLNLCDSMGFIVMDEAFDMWARKKSPHDYAQFFKEWHEKDLSDFIKRDRNHPSVIMWSIGNEILEQWHDISTDTLDIEKANLMFNFAAQLSKQDTKDGEIHVNSLLCKKLVDFVKALDPTRPVTAGNNETEPHNLLFKANALDIIGFNYHEYNWGEKFKEKFPGMPLIITESTSALQTRGHYIAPADTQYLWPVRWDIPFDTPDHKCSAYDNVRAPWGSTHETTLKEYMKYPWVSGIFVWTGFDYLGEPTPYGWPSRSSYFGIIDLAGFEKDVYYLYQSLWTNKDVLHLLPHWNWTEGETIDVVAYTNAEEVELFLNGESLGVKKLADTPDKLHLSWKVPFKAGELKAVGKKNGHTFSQTVKTAGIASQLSAAADRNDISADGEDLSFITVNITDENGTIVPNADNKISFEISGPGEIVGLDNGDEVCHESFKGNSHSAFNGKCLCIVKSKRGEKGTITVNAKADGLKEAMIVINTK